MKKNKGITLIALVITIIILLILAGITISSLTSDKGIIKKVDEAKEKIEIGQEKEGIIISYEATKMESEDFTEIKNTELQKQLDSYFGRGECKAEYNEEEKIYTISFKSGREYTIEEDGTLVEGKYDKWDGTTATEPTQKTNTEIHITTASELKWLSDQVNGGNTFEGYTVYLDNNLDLGARKNNGTWDTEANKNTQWTAIGTNPISILLKATFEGNGHIIKGVYINKPNDIAQGIFGAALNVRNITIKDSCIQGQCYVAGIVGVMPPNSEIMNCHNINTDIIGKKKEGEDYSYIGGVVGAFNGKNISNCTNSGKVTGTGGYIGGIMGMISSYGQEVKNCSNSGSITGASFTGGIVGYASATKIVNCYNAATVTGKNTTGGIVGYASATKIENCYNLAEITGEEYTGGILAYTDSEKIIIEKSYNNGKIKSTTRSLCRRNSGIYCSRRSKTML